MTENRFVDCIRSLKICRKSAGRMVKVAIGMAKMVYISSLYVNVRVHISNWCNASVMFKSARLHIFKLYNTNVRSYDTLLLTYFTFSCMAS